MADDESPDTRRTGGMAPPRPVPTLLTLQSAVDTLTGQVRGYRDDVEAALARADQAVLRFSAPPSIESLTPLPPQRPSMAAAAAKGTAKAGSKLLLVLGAVAAIGQVVAAFKPQYAGPIAEALKLLASLVGG